MPHLIFSFKKDYYRTKTYMCVYVCIYGCICVYVCIYSHIYMCVCVSIVKNWIYIFFFQSRNYPFLKLIEALKILGKKLECSSVVRVFVVIT